MKKHGSMAVALVVLLLAVTTAGADDKPWQFEKIGADFTYGRDAWLPDSLQGDHSDNIVERISLRAESDSLVPHMLSDSWSQWTVGAEVHYSAHKANEHPDHDQDTGFHETGCNLILKRNLFDRALYLGVLAGLSYVSNFPKFEDRDWSREHRYSDIGRSHCLYTVGVLLGRDWQLFKSAWSLRTEGRLVHTADPFWWSYDGKNFASYVVGLTYRR